MAPDAAERNPQTRLRTPVLRASGGGGWPWVWLALAVACLCGDVRADVGPRNLAHGKKVVFSPPPNYALTARGGTDPADLTDGELSTRKDHKIWFDAGAVGWSYAGLGQMAVDLGEVSDVGGVVMSWQGGSPQAGVCVPCWIHVLASEDGRTYHRVGSFSRWREGDRQKFRLPREEGKAWVHQFSFEKLDVRARHVGVEIYGTGLSVADELWVLRHPRAGRKVGELPATDFTVAGPRMYFHKPVLHVPIHINAPTPIGWIVPPGLERLRVTATIDLPKGVRFVGGRFGGAYLAGAKGEAVEGGAYGRYTFSFFAGKSNKAWRRVYLRADWPDGKVGLLRHRLQWEGGGTPRVEQPIRAVRIAGAPQPKRLMTGLGWWNLPGTTAWPDALTAWKHMGLNTLPLFGRWAKLDDPNIAATIGRFRRAGFRVMNIDSTFHHMFRDARGRKSELTCRFGDGEVGEKLCPSYRGELYEKELDRVARECVRSRADYLSCDIELWGWRGPADAEKCTRCRADYEKSGATDWAAWRLAKGEQMWRALADRVRAACRKAGVPPPELGVYDFRPGHDYQSFWPFDRLYPKYMGNSQVSTYTPLYPYHLALIGDEVRADRARLPRSDVLPWITPGDAGTFPGEAFTWALLECFANGARGVHFWSGRVWDAETLAAYARAIRIAAPVEDVIVDGRLVGEAVKADPAVRVSGMCCGDEMFLLVADYASKIRRPVELTLPPGGARRVMDLDTGRQIARLTAAQRRFGLDMAGRRAAALHVRPLEGGTALPARRKRKGRHVFSVQGTKTYLNGREIRVIGLRCSNALISDATADQLIDNLDTFAGCGVNTVSVYFQGSRFGDVRGYRVDGSLDPVYAARMGRIVEAADARGMIVLVGCLYWGNSKGKQDSWTQKQADAAVANTAAWLKANDYRNVFVDVDNEGMARKAKGFDNRSMVKAGKAVDASIMIATNYRGAPPPEADLAVHHSRRAPGKPYIESEGTPANAPGGYWGSYSKRAGYYNYLRIGLYNEAMKREQIARTKAHLAAGEGYMLASTWLQCVAPHGPNMKPGGTGSKGEAGIRWWLEFVRKAVGPYKPPPAR